MKIWTIPYVDQELSFWEEIDKRFGEHVKEVYFPLPGGLVGSGRGRQPDRFLEDFLRRSSLSKSVLVNPIVLPKPVEEIAPQIISALQRLQDDFGVRSGTVANLSLARLIKESLPGMHLTTSVLMGIASPSQVLMVQDYFDAIVPANTLLRDLNALKKLRQAFSGEMRLIVNEACLPGCPYRTQHFYEMASNTPYPLSLCQEILEVRPWLRLTGAWILPKHLHYYDGLYDSLKLAGRVTLQDRAKYLRVLDAYVHRKPILPHDIGGGPASVLEDIDMPDSLFEFILQCDKTCNACSVCFDYYERVTKEVSRKSSERLFDE